jgi:hypothetical protein
MVSVRFFDKGSLQGIVCDDFDGGLERIDDEIVEHSRWAVRHRLIFKAVDDGKLYCVHYRVGATESQDEAPFDNEGAEIECVEVVAVDITVTKYLPIGAR